MESIMLDRIEELIMDSVRRLTEHTDFVSWKQSKAPASGDILLVNNSFISRDVEKAVSDKYLSLVMDGAADEMTIGVASRQCMRGAFMHIAAASTNKPDVVPLKSAIKPQMDSLGHLVFLLIGEIRDDKPSETDLNHGAFKTVVWDPTITDHVSVDGNRIVVKQTSDEELIWQHLSAQLNAASLPAPLTLREALDVALAKLQEQAVAIVVIPPSGEEPRGGITDAIIEVVKQQREQYANAAALCESGNTEGQSALNDVLRIAYNFASDATGYLRLIASVCDLKPIVRWGTIAEHYELSAAFAALPWSRFKNKPSLDNYRQTIADARNSAFHNLFPFRKSLRIKLPEAALGAPQLQIFSERAKKGDNQLTYQDKELVEVLVKFTRARERSLPLSFWQKNLVLMDATITLFKRTNEFLKALRQCSGG
jgi:hypothetical protein